MYSFKRTLPVAKFFYRGQHHDRPVRRTVLIIEQDRQHLTGYELREGAKVRKLKDAPVKTYSKSKIATTKQLKRKKPGKEITTLRRDNLVSLIISGA